MVGSSDSMSDRSKRIGEQFAAEIIDEIRFADVRG